MSKARAQAGLEAVAVVAFLAVVFLVANFYGITVSQEASQQQSIEQARGLSQRVALFISLASRAEGLSFTFTVPSGVQGASGFSLRVTNSSVVSTWISQGKPLASVTQFNSLHVTNSTSATDFVLPPGAHIVRSNNLGGAVID